MRQSRGGRNYLRQAVDWALSPTAGAQNGDAKMEGERGSRKLRIRFFRLLLLLGIVSLAGSMPGYGRAGSGGASQRLLRWRAIRGGVSSRCAVACRRLPLVRPSMSAARSAKLPREAGKRILADDDGQGPFAPCPRRAGKSRLRGLPRTGKSRTARRWRRRWAKVARRTTSAGTGGDRTHHVSPGFGRVSRDGQPCMFELSRERRAGVLAREHARLPRTPMC